MIDMKVLNKKISFYIPSVFTALNLLLGFFALLINEPLAGCLLILAGAGMDVLDGAAARLFNSRSETGKQLDSLADMVTFGVAPAFLYYHYVLPAGWISIAATGMLPAGAAIRLARFNVSTNQKNIFRGLPSPASGLFFAAFPLFEGFFSLPSFILLMLPVIAALLMNSNFPMFSAKTLKYGLQENIPALIFIVISAGIFIFLIAFREIPAEQGILVSIPLMVVVYLLVSLLLGKKIRKLEDMA